MKYILAFTLAVVPAVQKSAPPTRLHFNWPAGVSARVETDYVRESRIGPATQVQSHLRISHIMRVLPHPEGREVHYENQTYLDSSGDLRQEMVAVLQFWVPRRIVSGDGRFIRVEDTERLQQTLSEMFEPLLGSAPAQMLPLLRDYLRTMISGDAPMRLAAADWDQVVGRWVGIDIKEEMLTGLGAMPVAPDFNVPMTVSTGMTSHVACMRGEAKLECGVYELKEHVDADALAAVAQRLLRGATGDLPPPPNLTDLETIERSTLESATMLPHVFEKTRTARDTRRVNGEVVEATEVERVRSVFTYLAK
jgi:hypothetical protein